MQKMWKLKETTQMEREKIYRGVARPDSISHEYEEEKRRENGETMNAAGK